MATVINDAVFMSEQSNENSMYVRTCADTYNVDASPDVRSDAIKTADGLPIFGEAHSENKEMFVNDISASFTEDDRLSDGDGNPLRKWTVIVKYSSDATGLLDPITGLPRPPWELGAYNYTEDVKNYTKIMDKAKIIGEDGGVAGTEPIINTLGSIIKLEQPVTNLITRFSYDILTFGTGWSVTYNGTVNKSTVIIAGNNYSNSQTRINKLSKKARKWNDGTKYYTIDVELETESGVPVNRVELLNADYKFKDSEDKIRPIQLKDGVYGFFNDSSLNVQEPLAIGILGNILDLRANPQDALYLGYFTATPSDWSVLGMPAIIEERN